VTTPVTWRKRWRWVFVFSLLLLAVSFTGLTTRRHSDWHISLDFLNWRIRGAKQIEFNNGGLEVRTRTTRYIGPIAISFDRVWAEKDARPYNGSSLY
jgi:hypothetical protein